MMKAALDKSDPACSVVVLAIDLQDPALLVIVDAIARDRDRALDAGRPTAVHQEILRLIGEAVKL